MSFTTPDVVVIGSGAGGGTAAHALSARGLRVLVLEKGGRRAAESYLPYDELIFGEFQSLVPAMDDAGVYVDPGGTLHRVRRWWVVNAVGGATTIWESNLPRYTSEDFSSEGLYPGGPPSGTSQLDWPWSYDEFHPHFERAEWEWGVSGAVGQSPAQEPFRAKYGYPMPPLRPHASTPFLKDIFGRAGMYPYATAKGINSRTYDGRPGCPFCGFCQGFGCAVNDRANSWNTVLRRALATGNCEIRSNHYVTRIAHSGGKVRGVFVRTSVDSAEQYLACSTVVLSAQAIESARLFLLSDIPDPNDLVGHYLTYHTKGSVEAVFPGLPAWNEGPDSLFQPTTAVGTLQIRDLYRINDDTTRLGKGGKFSVYDPYTTSTPIKVARSGMLWGRELVRRLDLLRSHAGVGLSFTGEAMSVHSNRVVLDPDVCDPWGVPVARTYYKHHDYDLSLSSYALDRVAQILSDGGGDILVRDPQTRHNAGYGHNHGTLRAGKRRDASVLDPMCQSYEVRGLYVLDASWMPTSGASNPTLTVIANAYRVCGQLNPGA